MHKYLRITAQILIVLSIIFVLAKVVLYKQALRKQQYIMYLERNNDTFVPEHSEVLDRLQQLTQIPLVGSFFMGAKIEELIRLDRFQEGLALVDDLVSSVFNCKNYRLWLAKAKAQFGLKRYEESEESLVKASAYAGSRWEDFKVQKVMDKINNQRAYQTLQDQGFDVSEQKHKKQKERDYEEQLRKKLNEHL